MSTTHKQHMGALEMEEVEDLIAVHPNSSSSNNRIGSGKRRAAASNSNSIMTNMATTNSFKRKGLVLLVCVAFLLIWIMAGSGSNSGDVIEDDGTVTYHNATSVKTTSRPTMTPPTDTATPPPAVNTPPPTPPPPETDWRIPLLPQQDPFHVPISNKTRDDITAKYGQWHFWDGDEDMRPKHDYLAGYPNKDIPGNDFPDTAWQVDAVYVNHFLNDADLLVTRAMEAIFEEYGHGKPLPPEKMMERMKMFHWEKLDLAEAQGPPANYAKRGARDTGGWTTQRSFQGVVRRLLHAMMTRDTFTVVLAGHSAAAGAGNHFRQSYMMQFHKIMAPIFARLNVKLITRNISQGGLGTIQGAMGSANVYGNQVDLLLWDSGMTEGPMPHHVDLFLRQGLLGGNRVPVLWGGSFGLLKLLHEECHADVGELGLGTVGIPVTENEEQAETIPFAARYFKCSSDRSDLCGDRFRATCWIDREDNITPETQQLPHPKSQVKWHPGWRPHQLQGRVLAFSVLEALQSAINTWSESTMSGQPLDDSYWHVTDYYDNIRTRVQNLNDTAGECFKIKDQLPSRMCKVPMKARTQYTPRANFEESGITSILQSAPDGYVPKNKKVALYEGPDVHNPNYDIPEGEVDVLAIVMNRRRLEEEPSSKDGNQGEEQNEFSRNEETNAAEENGKDESKENPTVEETQENGNENKEAEPSANEPNQQGNQETTDIIPGKGWEVFDEPQGTCDGEYLSICGRSTDNPCILEGAHDARGAIVGSELSGWLVMNLDEVKEGIIVVKLHTWHYASENPSTEQWTSVNNNEQASNENRNLLRQRPVDGNNQVQQERNLMRSYNTPELPDSFAFDYAINGKITTLDKAQFLESKQQVQRVVETLTLLDDENFPATENVQVAIRLRGVGRNIVFGVSHIYWA